MDIRLLQSTLNLLSAFITIVYAIMGIIISFIIISIIIVNSIDDLDNNFSVDYIAAHDY